VVGGSIDAITVTSPGSGFTYEAGLEVIVSSGGVGCEGLVLHARIRALRLQPSATSVVVSKVGRLGLAIANGSHGPTYGFSIEVASVSGTSSAALVQNVTILPFPARLASFAVVPGSVSTSRFDLAWSPSLPLRLFLSLDGGVSFLSHPSMCIQMSLSMQNCPRFQPWCAPRVSCAIAAWQL
jgi:hypothetical protein